MKKMIDLTLKLQNIERELKEFKDLLDSKAELSESKDILPFFKSHLQLSALIGSIHGGVHPDIKYAHEFSLIGDNTCDLVTYSKCNNAYSFIEFEDASESSVFKKNGNKAELDWAPRFEHGFSQIVDWFWTLDDIKQTSKSKSMLGTDNFNYHGILVIGRSAYISDFTLQSRLDWRSTNVLINSKPILCLTYDDLYEQLEIRISAIKSLSNFS